MLRNSTKLTSLLAVAATMASMVPAMAADVTRVDSKEGKIYNAVAFKDGKFYVDGSPEDKSEAAYYFADGKYTDLDNIDSGDEIRAYGSKYVEEGKENDGDYYLNLETGKVTDDSVAKDAIDDASSAIRNKIKKDGPSDRYAETEYKNNIIDADTITAPYADDYYEIDIKANTDKVKNDNNGAAETFHVYSDAKGSYVDADYNVGKITFAYGNDKVRTLDNTKDDKDGFRVAVDHVKTLAQDKDNVYRLAKVRFTKDGGAITTNDQIKIGGSHNNNKISAEATTSDAAQLDKIGAEYYVIQKISKAQASGDVDDAKYAKTVSTYFVCKDDGADIDDDKYNYLMDSNTKFAINDGKLILAAEKDKDTIQAYAISLKSKNGLYYTDFSDGSDCDVEVADGIMAYTFDANGNLWTLDGGNVKKFDNDEDFDKVYKVDGSMSQLSVYDKDNLVVWDEDDEVYSIVAGKAAEDTTAADTTTTAQAGWVQNADSTWSYINADGTKAIGWLQSPASGLWYYMDANGIMETNKWVQDGGKWFFVTESGAMKTGWLYNGGAWYYLNTISGQKGGLGCMQTGWVLTGGKWYYCNASGAMLANTTVNGYVLGADGAWIK